jgi:hypothetical protein
MMINIRSRGSATRQTGGCQAEIDLDDNDTHLTRRSVKRDGPHR